LLGKKETDHIPDSETLASAPSGSRLYLSHGGLLFWGTLALYKGIGQSGSYAIYIQSLLPVGIIIHQATHDTFGHLVCRFLTGLPSFGGSNSLSFGGFGQSAEPLCFFPAHPFRAGFCTYAEIKSPLLFGLATADKRYHALIIFFPIQESLLRISFRHYPAQESDAHHH
jgi:hypothetical protein